MLVEPLQAFVTSDNWLAARKVVEEYPKLLSVSADALLAQWITEAQQQSNSEAAQHFQIFRERLARARKEGLDEAIAVYREALLHTPPRSPHRQGRLNNLGTALRSRFSLRGQASDLDEAIALYREALLHTPPGSPDRPGRLNNLGTPTPIQGSNHRSVEYLLETYHNVTISEF